MRTVLRPSRRQRFLMCSAAALAAASTIVAARQSRASTDGTSGLLWSDIGKHPKPAKVDIRSDTAHLLVAIAVALAHFERDVRLQTRIESERCRDRVGAADSHFRFHDTSGRALDPEAAV